jgi:hypothetical protein
MPKLDTSQFGNYSDWAKGEKWPRASPPSNCSSTLAQSGAKVEQPHSGNWFTHLLPTIGSVAIPALGALLAPETGGLSLIAAAGLSGLGAAGGKLAENATEGKDLGDGVVGEGIMGAAGGAAGGVAGKFLGKAAGGLSWSRPKSIASAQTAQEPLPKTLSRPQPTPIKIFHPSYRKPTKPKIA